MLSIRTLLECVKRGLVSRRGKRPRHIADVQPWDDDTAEVLVEDDTGKPVASVIVNRHPLLRKSGCHADTESTRKGGA